MSFTWNSPLIELVKTPGRKKAALKKPNHLQHANSLEDKNWSTSSIETFYSVPLGSPGDHIRKIETLPQTSKVLPVDNKSQVPTAQVETFPQTDVVPPLELSTTPVETFPQIDEVLPIEVPTTSVETFSKTDEVLPIEVLTTPVKTFPKTDEVVPIEVPTTPVETFSQTEEVLPVEVPTAPSSQLLYERDRFLTDIQEEDVEMSVKLNDKPIPPPSFPTLPEPVPLRKSTKPRDPSINAVLLGAATPGAPVGGMRTSWLMKVREANIDKMSKKSHPPGGMGSEVGASSSLTIQGTKRKSDAFSLPQVGIRDDERPLKLAKTSSETEGEMESKSQPPAIVESAPEGVFDRLKKVVEDLGIRVGKWFSICFLAKAAKAKLQIARWKNENNLKS